MGLETYPDTASLLRDKEYFILSKRKRKKSPAKVVALLRGERR